MNNKIRQGYQRSRIEVAFYMMVFTVISWHIREIVALFARKDPLCLWSLQADSLISLL